MIKTILCFLLLLISLYPKILFAQKKTLEAVLTGKTTIAWSREIRLGDNLIPLSADGTFHYKLKINTPGFYPLSHENKKTELFFSPGDSLDVQFDTQNTVVTGSNAALNKSIQEHDQLAQRNGDFLDKNNKAVFSLNFLRFSRQMDSLKQTETRSLQEFTKKHTGADNFIKSRLAADINYRYKFYRLLYPHNYNRHTGKKPPVRPDYFDVIAQESFNHPELVTSDAYVKYVNFYLDIQAAGKYKFQNLESGPVERINSRYQAILNLPANQQIKDFLIGQHFKKAIENYSVKDLQYCFSQYEKDCKNEAIKQQVRQLYKMGLERRKEAHEIKIFKKTNDFELEAHIFYPKNVDKNDKRPAYLFFHGGGWATGMPEWGYSNCKKYSNKGMVAISFEYRLRNVHGTHIAESVSDALSAVSWVREHAHELGINSEKIIAAGFSAGAHLAACTALMSQVPGIQNKQRFSSKPNALILQSAAYSIVGRDADKPTVAPELLSPLHLIQTNMVPALLFHGQEDDIVDYSEFEKFIQKIESTSNDFVYRAFKGRGHFFYDPESNKTIDEMSDKFLVAHGYL